MSDSLLDKEQAGAGVREILSWFLKLREVRPSNCACCGNCLNVYQPVFTVDFDRPSPSRARSRQLPIQKVVPSCLLCGKELHPLDPSADMFVEWV